MPVDVVDGDGDADYYFISVLFLPVSLILRSLCFLCCFTCLCCSQSCNNNAVLVVSLKLLIFNLFFFRLFDSSVVESILPRLFVFECHMFL